MASIQNRDYETVSAQCEHCGADCVFNRVSDIGEPGPYAGRYVVCLECGKQFWIYGDLINPAYDLFISDANRHFNQKRYMLCIASLAQAWEIFFSTFARANYLYRPFFATLRENRNLKQLNQLQEDLHQSTRKFTFYPLRNLLINTLLNEVHPTTLQECETAISRIETEKFGSDPKQKLISDFPDGETREIIQQLQSLKIAGLRNKTVHQAAYRPHRSEVENCHGEEIELLYHIKHTLQVGEFSYIRFLSSRKT